MKGLKRKPLASWRPLTSQKEARKVTSKFHDVTKEIEALKRTTNNSDKLSTLELELNEMGGRTRYQEASILLTSLNKSSSKWVFQNITLQKRRPKKGELPLKVLEIGAINTQLLSCPWLDVLAIDIESRNPKIKTMDFFDLPIEPYDVICNAMVLNCVPTALQRGDMLLRCVRMMKDDGLFLLVVPVRFMQAVGNTVLVEVLQALGLNVFNRKNSPKIAFLAATKTGESFKMENVLRFNRKVSSVEEKFRIEFNVELMVD